MRFRGSARSSFCAAVVAGLMVVVGMTVATPAKASQPSGSQFYNIATHLCLDDSASNGLRVFACSEASYQNGYQAFNTITTAGGGHSFPYTAIQNVNTGMCLDDSAANGLRDFPCNNASMVTGYQTWIVTKDLSSVYWQLKNMATGLCLDDSVQYGLRGFPCSDASFTNGYQEWYQ